MVLVEPELINQLAYLFKCKIKWQDALVTRNVDHFIFSSFSYVAEF